MNFILSLERYPGHVEIHGFHLGYVEWIARRIVEEKMQTCRENGWPMVTMALLQDCRLYDTLYRDGKWHSDIA